MKISHVMLKQLAIRVAGQLGSNRQSVATAESCTGGFIAKVLTDIPGSSTWFTEGFVTYSNEAKQRRLAVTREALRRHGAVSGQVARLMARGVLVKTKANFSIAVTGIAGPTGAVPGKPVGTVWLAWGVRTSRGIRVLSTRRLFRGSRDVVRRKTVRAALRGLLALASS